MIAAVVALLGWASCGVAPERSVFYRTSDSKGVSWLVSPRQPCMWSFAPDCVGIGGDSRRPDNPGYNGRALFRSDQAWALDTVAKLRSWGFNSLGGWCDTDILERVPATERLPYIIVLHLGAYAKAPWDDLYSPANVKLMRDAAVKLIPPVRDDPYLIGYCTDNELGWWDDTLFLNYLKFKPDAPGKRAIIESLTRFYHGDFGAFRRDWQTDAADFVGLAQVNRLTLKPHGTGIRAVHAFNHELAVRYYKLVHDMVRQFDPNHMILGDRYCQYYNLETAEAIAPFTDVVSTNEGADWLDGSYTHFQLDTLHRLTGKPVLITEYYFAARENQSGNRNTGEGFPTVQTQAERARGFAACTRHFASLPYVVGAHWFQFTDEPPKGRGDGEDFNMGFVDVRGKPYADMVAASRSLDIATIHRHPVRATQPVIPAAPPAPMRDNLLHWDRARGYVPSPSREQWADLYACHDRGNLYLGLVVMEYIDASLYAGGKAPPSEQPCFSIRVGTWHATVRFGSDRAVCSDPRVTIAEKGGLKRTLILKLPADGALVKPSTVVRIAGELTSHSRGYRMTWRRALTVR